MLTLVVPSAAHVAISAELQGFERLGHAADGVVRAGCACYTTGEEVDRLIAAVADIAS